jgi:hypothetical protein
MLVSPKFLSKWAFFESSNSDLDISQSDLRVQFGIGVSSKVAGVELRRPSVFLEHFEHFEHFAVDAIHSCRQSRGYSTTCARTQVPGLSRCRRAQSQ